MVPALHRSTIAIPPPAYQRAQVKAQAALHLDALRWSPTSICSPYASLPCAWRIGAARLLCLLVPEGVRGFTPKPRCC